MSVAELTKSISRLTPEQQAVVVRFVSKVRRSSSPPRRRQLSATMRAMNAGKKYSQVQVDEILARHPPRK